MQSVHNLGWFLVLLVVSSSTQVLCGQPAQPVLDGRKAATSPRLHFVAIVTRHGVRSPTSKGDPWNAFTSAPWPEWNVAPGYLTAHGAELMRLVGVYDRQWLAHEGLVDPQGCTAAKHLRILADSDQRTRETGKAWAEGFAPGCGVAVAALAEGHPDALFHPLEAGIGPPDKQHATDEVAARLGSNPASILQAHHAELQLLEQVLTGCKGAEACPQSASASPRSLFDVPLTLSAGHGDHLVDLRSPLSYAATMTENLLLEYAEGFEGAKLGWGRLDRATLNTLIGLHTANEDLTQRTASIARAQASNLLFHLSQSMEQAVTHSPVEGSLSREEDNVLVLVGHDTNLANLAGALHLTWTADGRSDDTPPGGALIFEIWEQTPAVFVVKTYFTVQTLDQMRASAPLTLAHPPERFAVSIPGCGTAADGCSWTTFQALVNGVVDRKFVH